MRVFFVALVCSAATLGQAALAQTDTPAVPSASAQQDAPAATSSPAAAAAAATAPATVAEQSTSASANLDEIVCKNEAPATGTRLGGGRECHTVREWNERQRQSQDVTRQQETTGFVTKGH